MASVLRLITRLNIGGPARQALLLTKELARDYPTVLAAGRSGPSESELADPEVQPVRIPIVRRPSPLDDMRGLAAVRGLIQTHQPAIVHTHMAKAGTLGRVAGLNSRPRPRLVHTFHGHVLNGYFGPLGRRAALEAERRLGAKTDVLVAVSEEIKNQLLELDIGRPESWRVIPVGLDLSRHAAVSGPQGEMRERLKVPPGIPLIGIVGRLAAIKDHATLLTAMIQLPDVHLAIVGDGGLRKGLERLTRHLGLAGRVHFTGWIHDIPWVMSGLDLVVLTSVNEGTPVSLIEALACGTPVVSTGVGGVCSVVEEGKTGFLTPSRVPRDIAQTIRTALESLPAARRMTEAARPEILLRFGRNRLVRDIKALYDELLRS